MRRTFLVLVALVSSAVSSSGQEAGPLDRLTSPVPEQRTRGLVWVDAHGEAEIEARLSRRLSIETVRELTWLVSRFASGKHATLRHNGHVNLGAFPDAVERATDHPLAARVRDAAMQRLSALLERVDGWKEGAEKPPEFPGVETTQEIQALAELLVEVADDATVDRVVALALAARNGHVTQHLMALVEQVLGAPPYHQMVGFCGTMPADELNRLLIDAEKRTQASVQAMARDWKHLRDLARAPRLALLVNRWEDAMTRGAATADAWTLMPLLRQGNDGLAAAAAWEHTSNATLAQAWDVLVAAHRGVVNAARVKRLLLGAPGEVREACHLIRVARSRDFKGELAAALRKKGETGLLAAETLAIVHRDDALELLRAARDDDPENYMAKEAIEELDSWRR